MHSPSSSKSAKNSPSPLHWLQKPRLFDNCLDCPLKKRRFALISSSSSSSEENLSKCPPKTVENVQITVRTLKSVREQLEKYRENDTDVVYSEDDEFDYNDQAFGISSENSGPSSFSELKIVQLHQKRAKNQLMHQCVQFFNTASEEKLAMAPKCSTKVVDFILAARPFKDYDDLDDKFVDSELRANLRSIPEVYLEYLQNRHVLDSILCECQKQADSVKDTFNELQGNEIKHKPALLNQQCTLQPHQQIGLNWLMVMHNLKLNSILGDEMGLGKTIQIVAFLAHLKEIGENGPHLIIVPSSTIDNWLFELEKWWPSVSILTYWGNQNERRQLRAKVQKDKFSSQTDVLLTTYSMVSSKSEDRLFFKHFRINYVIFDEGHMLKNCNSNRYRNLMKIRGMRKILLTGTPLQNSLVELISLMFFTNTSLFTDHLQDVGSLLQQFQQLQKNENNGPEGFYEREKIDQAKSILTPFILRRLKKHVLTSLPEKIDRIKKCPLPPVQLKLYQNIADHYRNLKLQGEKLSGISQLMELRKAANHPLLHRIRFQDQQLMEIATGVVKNLPSYRQKLPDHVAEDLSFMSDFSINKLASMCPKLAHLVLSDQSVISSAKCLALDELLPEILTNNAKVLLFSQFTTMLDILEVYLNLRNYSFLRLDGSTPVMDRQQLVDNFNADEDVFVFLLSTKAGGLGINLTSASVIIQHDIDFNPYNDRQAEDRCHRIGQTKEVTVIRLIAENTVDEQMLECGQRKMLLERQVTGDGNDADSDDDAGMDKETEQLTIEILLNKALSIDE